MVGHFGDRAMQNALFLCTGNSGRSIMAEAMLRHWSDGMFTAFSAGSHPADEPHGMALEALEARDIPIHGLRSKNWDEFGNPHAPAMDLVITVCDTVANEVCPVLPGAPLQLHWGLPNPSSAQGDESAMRDAFAKVCDKLEKRIAQMVTIPFADRAPESIQADLDAIAASDDTLAEDLTGEA
jgi:arsenate reductase